MNAPLFRPEVLEARRDAWLGEAQLVQPLSVRVVAAACLFLVASFAAYGALGTYTRRVHAEGVLMPDVGLVTLAAPVAGRVASSSAKEGDHVAKGQLLYTLNLDSVTASGPTQQRVIDELKREKASVESQRALKAASAVKDKQSLADEIGNLEARSKQLDKQIALQQKLVVPLRDRVGVLSKALAQGLVRSADFQTQNYIYLQASAQLAQFQQVSLQVQGKLASLKSQLANFDNKLAQNLAELDRASAQLDQQIAESEAHRTIEVRAPEGGTLTSIRVQPGQEVAAGATLLTLLPRKGRLQANLFVDSASIGFIRPGAVVMLRYAAFPFQRFGLYRGVVSEVTRAPIAGTDGSRSQGGTSKSDVYRVVVRPDQDSVVAYGQRRRLEAGMQVAADIELEKRPLYLWLFDPLRHMQRSFDLVTNGT